MPAWLCRQIPPTSLLVSGTISAWLFVVVEYPESCGCPIPAMSRPAWRGLEHPGVVEDVPAHGRGSGDRVCKVPSNPKSVILEYHHHGWSWATFSGWCSGLISQVPGSAPLGLWTCLAWIYKFECQHCPSSWAGSTPLPSPACLDPSLFLFQTQPLEPELSFWKAVSVPGLWPAVLCIIKMSPKPPRFECAGESGSGKTQSETL